MIPLEVGVTRVTRSSPSKGQKMQADGELLIGRDVAAKVGQVRCDWALLICVARLAARRLSGSETWQSCLLSASEDDSTRIELNFAGVLFGMSVRRTCSEWSWRRQ